MAFDAHKNFGYSTVLTAPSPASSGTSLVVQSGDGTKFPAVSFNATIWPAGLQPTTTNAEIVRVTTIATDTFTITRAQESTSARTVIVGDQIAATETNKTFTDIETNVWSIALGGTGQTAKTAAFDALQPMTTAGDIIYGGVAGTGTRLAVGASTTVLGGGTNPSYIDRPRIYLSDAGATGWTNDVTAKTIFAAPPTFQANELAAGYAVEIEMSFTWINNTGATQTLATILKINGNNFLSYTTAAIAANTLAHNCIIKAAWRVNSNTQMGGYARLIIGGVGASTQTIADVNAANAQTLGNITTTTNAVDITCAMSTATATGTITPKGGYVKIIPNV